MKKLRCSVTLSFVVFGLLAGVTSAQAATLVEHNVQPLGLTPNVGSPPEFGRCLKVAGGEFEDSGCTKVAGASGSYEWHPAFGGSAPLEKASFSIALKEATVSTLETVTKTQMTCEGVSSGGQYTGNKTVGNVVVTFTKCSAFEASCATAGSPAGTVVTRTLEGTLGVEELGATPAENAIAEDLFPVGRSGPLAVFSCSGLPVTITGSLIAPVQSNAMKPSVSVKFKAAKGKQKPESFAGEPADVLYTKIGSEGSPEQSGETMNVIQTNEEKVEVNSVV
ncbi:MAG TPA: hypothetical protein VK761_09795 [Solirubrobacteraceae bacterium]|jgi:hypothetical protein|nr:hypothetical protein [Solirubrobacteraceae bacterium]